jgi:hypothetical protein
MNMEFGVTAIPPSVFYHRGDDHKEIFWQSPRRGGNALVFQFDFAFGNDMLF